MSVLYVWEELHPKMGWTTVGTELPGMGVTPLVLRLERQADSEELRALMADRRRQTGNRVRLAVYRLESHVELDS